MAHFDAQGSSPALPIDLLLCGFVNHRASGALFIETEKTTYRLVLRDGQLAMLTNLRRAQNAVDSMRAILSAPSCDWRWSADVSGRATFEHLGVDAVDLQGLMFEAARLNDEA